MQILHTQITHNERWPRKGVMYAPQYLLKKGDLLLFKWEAKVNNQELIIEIEKGESKKKIILPNSKEIRIHEDGVYSILIENLPKYMLYGYLTITLTSSTNKNPFPETKYIYEHETEEGQFLKKCKGSYIDAYVGANVIEKHGKYNPGEIIFDSTKNEFDENFESEKFIYTQKMFYFEIGQRVHISYSRPANADIYYGAKIEKVNSQGFYGNLTENCYFDCNSSNYYIVELFKSISSKKDESNCLGELKIFTRKKKNTIFDYQIVYNQHFRKFEIEVKEPAGNTV